MSSLAVLHQAVPNVGVIGSGSRRSPTQNPIKQMCISGNGNLENNNSSQSSISGEDGFISGSSSAEEIHGVEQLAAHFGILGIGKPNVASLNGINAGYSKLIDATLFSALNKGFVLEQSNLKEFKNRMNEDSSLAAYQHQFALSNQTSFIPPNDHSDFSSLNQTRQSQLPGAWFYENSLDDGLPESGSASTGVPGECSPIAELNDEYQFASFRALNNQFTTDSLVSVPSSEHVAEIVGRQGCKIKALRAKTNTYIKTPSRNEPPVFKITGRPEDVVEAKREIECAAEHFTQIRASRRHSQGGNPIPGHVTAYVRVPLRVVGLVVGPKGATIKRIQQDTHTYIITPSREREPIFEVTGLPENVASARREIEQHIYQRTGNMPITDPNSSVNEYELLVAAQQAAATQANANIINRPNYGALATGTHLRRASLEAARRQFNHPINDVLNEYFRPELIPKQYPVSSPPLPVNMFAPNTRNIYNPNDLSSNQISAFTRPANDHQAAGNYQSWTSGYTNNDLHNGNSAFDQDLFSSVNSNSGLNIFSNGFDLNTVNNLCNVNASRSAYSGSRDEGLGDSPTVSLGKLNEPYHLISTIWSDSEADTGEKTLESCKIVTA